MVLLHCVFFCEILIVFLLLLSPPLNLQWFLWAQLGKRTNVSPRGVHEPSSHIFVALAKKNSGAIGEKRNPQKINKRNFRCTKLGISNKYGFVLETIFPPSFQKNILMDTSSFPPFPSNRRRCFPLSPTTARWKKNQLPCRPQRANTSPTFPQILSFSQCAKFAKFLFSQVPVRGGQDKGGRAAEEPRQARARGADR